VGPSTLVRTTREKNMSKKFAITLTGEEASEVAKVLGIPDTNDHLDQNVYVHSKWVRLGLGDTWKLSIEFEGDSETASTFDETTREKS